MANLSLIITPPASTRASKTQVNQEILDGMVSGISSEQWVFDGQTYKTSKEANSAAGPYRRALPKALGIPPHTLKSKVWGEDKNGVVVTDRKKQATWRFAFTIDPDRKPKQRKQTTASKEGATT